MVTKRMLMARTPQSVMNSLLYLSIDDTSVLDASESADGCFLNFGGNVKFFTIADAKPTMDSGNTNLVHMWKAHSKGAGVKLL